MQDDDVNGLARQSTDATADQGLYATDMAARQQAVLPSRRARRPLSILVDAPRRAI